MGTFRASVMFGAFLFTEGLVMKVRVLMNWFGHLIIFLLWYILFHYVSILILFCPIMYSHKMVNIGFFLKVSLRVQFCRISHGPKISAGQMILYP